MGLELARAPALTVKFYISLKKFITLLQSAENCQKFYYIRPKILTNIYYIITNAAGLTHQKNFAIALEAIATRKNSRSLASEALLMIV